MLKKVSPPAFFEGGGSADRYLGQSPNVLEKKNK